MLRVSSDRRNDRFAAALREPVTGVQRWVGIGIVALLSAVGSGALVGLYSALVNTSAHNAINRSGSLWPGMLVPVLLAVLPLVTLAAGLAAWWWWRAHRLHQQIVGLAAVAEARSHGDQQAAFSTGDTPALRRLVDSVTRLSSLAQATDAMLRDRDQQLATIRGLDNVYYWETDAQGRYARIELPTRGRRPEIARLLGRFRWDDNARLLSGHWQDHRAMLGRHLPFDALILRDGIHGDDLFIAETGQPRLAGDGTLTGYVGTLRDVSAEMLQDTEQRLALSALAAGLEPVLLIETTGLPAGWRISWANPAACLLFERSANQLIQQPLADLFGAGQADVPARIGTALASGAGLKLNTLLMTRYAEQQAVILRLVPGPQAHDERPSDQRARDQAAHDPQPPERRPASATRRASLLIDARGPKLQELSRTVTAAEQLREDSSSRALELEVTARELESFSYTVSHDLRAPLRVVEGFARIVQEDYGHTLDRVGNEHLGRILSAAHRMNNMIDSLLALSSLSAKPVVPEEVDLSRLAAAVIDELRLTEPGRQISTDIQPALVTHGDPTLLAVVLQNLLGNAWKYSSKVPQAHITVSGRRDADVMVYCVADNGVGFDMRFGDRLFGVFQRLHSANDFPGTGVGLATVQRIVRRHGGRIWAESEPDKGARFYFTIWEHVPGQVRH